MNISGLPFANWIEKDANGKPTGSLTAEAQMFMEQLVSQLQKNLSDNGFFIPKKNSAYISANLSSATNSGLLVYDSDTNELKVNINGVIKVIQVI